MSESDILEPKKPRKRSNKKPWTDAPDDLTTEEKKKLGIWVKKNFPEIWKLRGKPGGPRWLVDSCLEHFRGEEEQKRDWLRTCQRWIRNHVLWEYQWKMKHKSVEMPQYDLNKRGKLKPNSLSEILRVVREGEE